MRQDDGGSVSLSTGWSGKFTLLVQGFQKDHSPPWPFSLQSLGTAKKPENWVSGGDGERWELRSDCGARQARQTAWGFTLSGTRSHGKPLSGADT